MKQDGISQLPPVCELMARRFLNHSRFDMFVQARRSANACEGETSSFPKVAFSKYVNVFHLNFQAVLYKNPEGLYRLCDVAETTNSR